MRKKALWIAGAASAAVALGGATIASAGSMSGDDQPLSGTALQQASDAAIARTGPGTVISAETDNDTNSSYEVGVRLNNGDTVEVDLNGSFEVVGVEGPGQDDDGAGSSQGLSGADRDKAGQAALASVGQGRVGEVERENDGASAYEVEIILDNGSEVDVELRADFQVLNTGAPERD
jgi:uncharacterized membrane protein YkoI